MAACRARYVEVHRRDACFDQSPTEPLNVCASRALQVNAASWFRRYALVAQTDAKCRSNSSRAPIVRSFGHAWCAFKAGCLAAAERVAARPRSDEDRRIGRAELASFRGGRRVFGVARKCTGWHEHCGMDTFWVVLRGAGTWGSFVGSALAAHGRSCGSDLWRGVAVADEGGPSGTLVRASTSDGDYLPQLAAAK
jgi:hypothetical protein